MLTVEKLKAMQPWEVIASGEWIDDGQTFNIWWNKRPIQWVAVRWKGYHDRAIYFHLYNEELGEKCEDIIERDYYYSERPIERVASNGDKLTRESTIRNIVPCDEEAFNLYRY